MTAVGRPMRDFAGEGRTRDYSERHRRRREFQPRLHAGSDRNPARSPWLPRRRPRRDAARAPAPQGLVEGVAGRDHEHELGRADRGRRDRRWRATRPAGRCPAGSGHSHGRGRSLRPAPHRDPTAWSDSRAAPAARPAPCPRSRRRARRSMVWLRRSRAHRDRIGWAVSSTGAHAPAGTQALPPSETATEPCACSARRRRPSAYRASKLIGCM